MTPAETMARDRIVATAHDEVAADYPDISSEVVEAVVETLVGMGVLMPSERWDETCHSCFDRIGNHHVDGRCPGQQQR